MNGGEVSRGSGQAHSIGSSCLDSDLIRGKHREEMRRWRRRGRVASTCDTPLAAVPIRKSPTCLLIKSWQMKTPHLLLKAAPASCHKLFFLFKTRQCKSIIIRNFHAKVAKGSTWPVPIPSTPARITISATTFMASSYGLNQVSSFCSSRAQRLGTLNLTNITIFHIRHLSTGPSLSS